LGVIEDLLAETPSGPIYHYTSNDGLLGITRTKTLWASKLHYLNDSTEFAYAIELVRSALKNRLAKERGPWNQFYGAALDRIYSIENVHVYVSCFSEAGDLLSQWRGYCPSSVGYSIAFDVVQLQVSMQRQKFRLVRCVYDEARQGAIVKELIDSAAESIGGTSAGTAAELLLNRIPEVAPALKHPQFSEEREWRLVSQGPVDIRHPQVRFRPTSWTLVPYYLFQLCVEPDGLEIDHVYVGPNPHMDLARDAAVLSLWNAGVRFPEGRGTGFDVRPSAVPYRGW
jgi:hypothetical protein